MRDHRIWTRISFACVALAWATVAPAADTVRKPAEVSKASSRRQGAGGEDRPPARREVGRGQGHAGRPGRRRRVSPPGLPRPRRQDPDRRRGPRLPRRPVADKRSNLVERLLDSPTYTARATDLYRQLLLPEADTEGQARSGRARVRGLAPQEGRRGRRLRQDGPRDPHRQARRQDRSTRRAPRPSPRPPRSTSPRKASRRTSPPAPPASSSASGSNAPSATTTRSPSGSGRSSGASPPSSPGSRSKAPPTASARSARSPTVASWPSPGPRRSSRPPSSTAPPPPGRRRPSPARSWPTG